MMSGVFVSRAIPPPNRCDCPANGQDLYVRVAVKGPDIYYQIFNPESSFLLEQMTSNQECRGQLWQSGDHVVEVMNRGNGATSYNVIFGID